MNKKPQRYCKRCGIKVGKGKSYCPNCRNHHSQREERKKQNEEWKKQREKWKKQKEELKKQREEWKKQSSFISNQIKRSQK